MAGTKNGAGYGGEAEGLASRWSRLKREARESEPAVPESADTAETDPEAAAGEAAEPLRVEDLPDVESLTYESDFTAFLREGVPEELQRLALRKLWRSDSVLANVDGLNDYDLDYRVLGVDTRVTEVLLAQREVKEKLLRDADDTHQRPSAVRAAEPTAEPAEAAAEEEPASDVPDEAAVAETDGTEGAAAETLEEKA